MSLRIKNVCVVIAAFVGGHGWAGEELTQEIVNEIVLGDVASFEAVDFPAAGSTTDVLVKLGTKVADTDRDFVFDGFRFTTPESIEGDFVWYFNVPSEWGQWYILPTTTEFKRGFETWIDADKIYEDFDSPREEGRLRTLQTLEGNYFEPNTEYVMWFREHETVEAGDSTLRARFGFSSLDEDQKWDAESVESALGLVAQDSAKQVEHLQSRGGRILLDKDFFVKQDADHRIDHLFWTKRQTVKMRSGFFITIKVSIPPCRTKPSLKRIRERFGAADFVRSSKEAALLGGDEKGKPSTITHYYDYFGFEVAEGDPDECVIQVIAQANDFSELSGDKETDSFAQMAMENLTVFHRKGAEVGRIYFFEEGEKKPLVIQEPPTGTYHSEQEELDFFGKGKWNHRVYFRDGTIARDYRYSRNRLNGKSSGFHENGNPYFIAEYKNGALHGELIRFAEDGSEESRETFVNGERME